MEIMIKKMESDDEIRGKAYVHWKCWQEAYTGMISQEYLDGLTLEKCEKIAFSWPDNIDVAKDGDRVRGFIGCGGLGDESPGAGEVYALYVLSEFYGKGVAQALMKAGLEKISASSKICLWVLKENKRAIRFYEKCGFSPTGEEKHLPSLGATDIRMIKV